MLLNTQNIEMSGESTRKLPFTYVRHPKLEKPYRLPQHTTQERFEDALSYQPLPGDIFVTTYPKCGTTWVIYALNLMRNGGNVNKDQYLCSTKGHPCAVPCLERGGKLVVENIKEKPRIIKSHLCKDLIPWSKEAKYIFVARNPKDCFNSDYYQTTECERINGFCHLSLFDHHLEVLLNGTCTDGEYFKCVPEWWEKSKTEPNVTFVLYEDLLQNPEREFLRIIDFVGEEWGQKVRENDHELLTKIVEGSKIEKMMENKEMISDIGHTPFVRKGTIGDWKVNFSKEQSERVDEAMRKTAEEYPGFDRLWDKYAELLKM